MKSLLANTRAVGDSAYFGDRPEWLIAFSENRDSDCLARSNFRCFKTALEKSVPAELREDLVSVERFSHWACGWIDYLIINPEAVATVALAEKLQAKLDDYPVLNEEDWSALESEEADSTWRNCYNVRERIAYIREHLSQFEFRGMADLLGCVRGKYFAGYASELLH